MRKLIPGLLVLALACNLVTRGIAAPTVTAPPPSATAPAPPTATAPALPTFAPPIPASPPCALRLQPADVLIHPEPVLYSGDQVSFEIVAEPACAAWQHAVAALYVGRTGGRPLATQSFAGAGLGGRLEAAFTWVWDTTGQVGPQTVIAELRPSAQTLQPADVLTLTVDLLPASQRPPLEAQARWQQVETNCCIIHYLSGTAAARDINTIEAQADQARTDVEARLGVHRSQKIDFTLLSRLLGQGGFASSSIALTYIDRNPVGNNLLVLFRHEQTHILDQEWVSSRPALMAEGLAVYMAGGHFKPNENLPHRAAALLLLHRYLPLGDLADNFYPAQHETGYLEGSAFITYLVDTYGWDRFKQFYQSFKAGPDRAVLDRALTASYGKDLSGMEADWVANLRTQPLSAAEVDDLRLTLALYDTMRRYQSQDDPSAYYLTAWMPDSVDAIRRGITADYLRHPDSAENVALEAMLVDAEHALEAGHFTDVDTLLNSINAVLDAHNLFFDPLAADTLQIVSSLSAAGYEAQSVNLDLTTRESATVTAIRDWPALETLTLARTAGGWQIAAPP
jgi:hypothetical protein